MKSSLLKLTNTSLLSQNKPHQRSRTRKRQFSHLLSFSSEMTRWSTQTLLYSMMPHQLRIQITILSSYYKICLETTELTRMLNTSTMLRNNTTQCTHFLVIFQMSPDKNLSTTLIQIAVSGVTTYTVTKFSQEPWTTAVFVYQPFTLTISMMLKFTEVETHFTTNFSEEKLLLTLLKKLVLKSSTLTEELPEVKLPRELLIWITTILSISATNGSMILSHHSLTGVQLKEFHKLVHTNTSKSIPWQLLPTLTTHSSHEETNRRNSLKES